MKISAIEVIWEDKGAVFDNALFNFTDVFYFKIDEGYFPHIGALGAPGTIMTALLQELRLFDSKSPVNERSVYCYQKAEGSIFSYMKLYMRKHDQSTLELTFYDRYGKVLTTCLFDYVQLIENILPVARMFLSKYEKVYPQGIEIPTLRWEIEKAQKIINKYYKKRKI